MSEDVTFPIWQREVADYFGSPEDESFANDYIDRFQLGELAPYFSHVKGLGSGFDCNYIMVDPLKAAFSAIAKQNLSKYLTTFDGCWVVRPPKSGGMEYSMHAFGLAIDVNALQNPFNKSGVLHTNLPDAFILCFTKNGFEWGGSWSSPKDPMHFQLPWIKQRTGIYAPVAWKV